MATPRKKRAKSTVAKVTKAAAGSIDGKPILPELSDTLSQQIIQKAAQFQDPDEVNPVIDDMLFGDLFKGLGVSPSNDSLRFAARLYFACSPNVSTVLDVQKHPRFQCVPLRLLRSWSAKDKWALSKRETQDLWLDTFAREAGAQLARVRSEHLQITKNIMAQMLIHLRSLVPSGNSYVGLLREIREYMKEVERLEAAFIENKADMAGDDVEGKLPTDVQLRLTSVEVTETLHTIARKRQEVIVSELEKKTV